MKTNSLSRAVASALLAPAFGLLPLDARSQLVISDTLNGASSSYKWRSLNGACLTAGDGTGTIPACVGLTYYGLAKLVGGVSGSLPDTPGNGALRLTNGDTTTGTNGNYQSGAVVSDFTFPTAQGLQVTFKTVTYGGNAHSNSAGQQSGADGLSFFLSDGSQAPTVGGLGGSLGYSCSNGTPVADGVVGGYIGLGIDEYGNFSNKGDNTNTGGSAAPSSIVLRGAGNVAWSWLTANYPKYYPSTLSADEQLDAVHNTCRDGRLYNYSGATIEDAKGNSIADKSKTSETVRDYKFLASSTLPSGVTLYSQEAVPSPKRGEATPITYSLKITSDGLLNLSYSVNGGSPQPLMTDQSITKSNGPLPASFRFGFSAGTGSGSNVHEIMCFKAAASNQSFGSAGANVQQSSAVRTGTQVYSAYFQSSSWSGNLTSQNLLYDAASDSVSIRSTANWDGSCVLTGGACTATGGNTTVQSPADRRLLTWSGSAGIPLQWASLGSAQQKALTAGDATATSARLDYLRGDRSKEISTAGTGLFRVRTSVLGDIIDSSPLWVGPPSQNYAGDWKDLLYPKATAAEGSTYAAFKADKATRLNVVYAGANDGFLHGFRAGAYDAKGNFVSDVNYPNDGYEVLGYMPGLVLNTIHSTTPALDYSSAQYGHNDYVDAVPGSGDLYYNKAWHTWLVGGLGVGGNAGGPVVATDGTAAGALYAIDVTDPANFGESHAADLVIGEWTSDSISCSNSTTCGQSLGSSTGTPIIRRMHNGQWAVIFGNGIESSSGTAGVFVMTVDPASGSRTLRFLDTGKGTSGSVKNGIVNVTAADLDGDHVADYLYAGDVLGNLWRFDVTSDDPTKWAASASALFSTGGKPITTSVVVASVPMQGSLPRALIEFATGRLSPQTQSSDVTYASGTQSMYGIWDWDLSTWNGLSTTRYASLTSPQTIAASGLTTQTVTATVAAAGAMPAYRTISSNVVCWKGSTTCGSDNTRYGWTLDLPGSGEQVVYNPALKLGMFAVNTTIPSAPQALSCDTQSPTGFSMSLSPLNGGASTQSFFASAGGSFSSSPVINGVGFGATGAPYLVTAGGKWYFVNQTSNGKPVPWKVNAYANGSANRLTWINLR